MRRVLILLIVLVTAQTVWAQRVTPSDVAGIAKALLSRCADGQVLVKDVSVSAGVRCATPGSGSGGIGNSSTTEVLVNNAGTVDGFPNLTFTTDNDNGDDARLQVMGASPDLQVLATDLETEPYISVGDTDNPTALFMATLGDGWSNSTWANMANSSLIWDQHTGLDSHGLILTTDNCTMHFTAGGQSIASEMLRITCDGILGIGPMTGASDAGMSLALKQDSSTVLSVMNGQFASPAYRDLKVRDLFVDGQKCGAGQTAPLTIDENGKIVKGACS